MKIIWLRISSILVVSLILASLTIPSVSPLSKFNEPKIVKADAVTARIGYYNSGDNASTQQSLGTAFANRGQVYGSYNATSNDYVSTFYFYGFSTVSDSYVDLGIYTFEGGVPKTRIGLDTIHITSATPQWWSVNVNISLTPGTVYVICSGNYTDNLRTYYDTGSSGDRSTASTGALPATWSQTGTNSERFSFYTVYVC